MSQPERPDKIAAVLGLIAGIAALVLAVCIVWFAIAILF